MSNQDNPYSKEENTIHELIMKAHDLFIELEMQHPDEKRSWVDAVHDIQNVLNARVLRRDYPNFYYNISKIEKINNKI